MLATWPMVIGALIVGALAGLLVPAPKQPATTSSTQVSGESPAGKPKRELTASQAKESPTEKDRVDAKAPPQQEPPGQDANACSQQTWPYYSPSCIDRTTPAAPSFRTVTTRPADPSIALRSGGTKQTAAPEPAPDRGVSPTDTQSPSPAREQTRTSHAASTPAQNPRQTATQMQTAQPAPAQPPPAQTAAPAQFPPRAQAPTQANRIPDYGRQSTAYVEQQFGERPRGPQPRGQARSTRVEPPEDWDDEPPRMLLRRDSTRIYVVPGPRDGRRMNDGYWRSW